MLFVFEAIKVDLQSNLENRKIMSHFKKTATSSLQTMTHKNNEKRNGEEGEKGG